MAKTDLDPELLKQAEELNIEVTDAATDETLKAAIDEVLAEDGGGAVDLAKLREAYKVALGKNAFNGWDAAELQKRIDAAGAPKPAAATTVPAKPSKQAAPHLVAVSVRRDFWDESGERHRKGTVVEVSVEAALDGVEVGALSRVR